MVNISPLCLVVAALAGAVSFLLGAGTILAIVVGVLVLVLISRPSIVRAR